MAGLIPDKPRLIGRCDHCGKAIVYLEEIDRGLFWCADCVEEEM